uniref:Saposin B-type domain-containing protein n=1 Tax=Plectus sambesii TaxID=2011161 RepID=A0A914VY08_9BILA
MNYIFLLLIPTVLIQADGIGSCDYCQVAVQLLQYPKGGELCKSIGACKDTVLSEKCNLVDKIVANGLAVDSLYTNPDQPESRDPKQLILHSVRRHILAVHQMCHGIGTSDEISKANPTLTECIECTLLNGAMSFVFDNLLGDKVKNSIMQAIDGVCKSAGFDCTLIDAYITAIFSGLQESFTTLFQMAGLLLSPATSCKPECVEKLCLNQPLETGC